MNEVKPRTLDSIEAVDPADNKWFGDMMILQVLADSTVVNDQERDVLLRWIAASERPSMRAALSSSPSEDGGEAPPLVWQFKVGGGQWQECSEKTARAYREQGAPFKVRALREVASPPPQGTGDADGVPGTPNDQSTNKE